MPRQFFFFDGQRSFGPVDEARVREDFAAGRVRPDALCSFSPGGPWSPLFQVAPDLLAPARPPAPPRAGPRWLLWLALAVGLILIGVGVVAYLTRGGSSSVAATPTAAADAGAAAGAPVVPVAVRTSAPVTLDLVGGGKVVTDVGVVLEVMRGAGAAAVTVTATRAGRPGEQDASGTVVSAEYELTAHGAGPVAPRGGFVVSLPVQTAGLQQPLREAAFSVDVFDDAAGAWRRFDGMPAYDAAAQLVSFVTPHFTRYRVRYTGQAWLGANVTQREYSTPSGHFRVQYWEPMFGQDGATWNAEWVPPADAEWAAKGRRANDSAATADEYDPAVPDYVEDVVFAAEGMLRGLLQLTDSAGGNLFTGEGLYPVTLEVRRIDGGDAGDTALGGPVAVSARKLSDWTDMRLVVAHELVHVLGDQHYTSLGARYNRWFYEAMANLWASRVAAVSRPRAVQYWMEGCGDYLKVSLDENDAGSYYAAAHFLDWLETATGRRVAADVQIQGENGFSDLANLASVLGGNSTLSQRYWEYGRVAVMGSTDIPSDRYLWDKVRIENPKPVQAVRLSMTPLTMHAIEVSATVPADGLLVCEPPLRLATSTYAGKIFPLATPEQYLEKTSTGETVNIPHFGAAGTAGVLVSELQQLVVAGADAADPEDGASVFYLLVAPQMTVDYANGHVAWTWTDPGHPTRGGSLIRGFNVYIDGTKMSDTPVGPTVRGATVGLGGPLDRASWIVVTVVDQHGNEWPTPEPPQVGLEGEWRGFITTQAAADATRGIPGMPALDSRVELKVVFERALPDGGVPSTLEYANPMNGAPMRIGMLFKRTANTLLYDLEAAGVHGHWEGIIRPDPAGRGGRIDGSWSNTMGAEDSPGFFFVEGTWEVSRAGTP